VNIFILDLDFNKCAIYHNDKHVIKLITEGVQLLSNAMHYYGFYPTPHKLSHMNHPCSKWVRDSKTNWQWLWNLCNSLGEEYTHRYNKKHLSHTKLIQYIPNNPNIVDLGLTPFANCTPYKENLNVVEAYRLYYVTHKYHLAFWKKRNIPEWYINIKEKLLTSSTIKCNNIDDGYLTII
jgi:hypothetical protein